MEVAMQLIISGKNLEVSDWLKEYVEKKIGKLDRYLPALAEARVTPPAGDFGATV